MDDIIIKEEQPAVVNEQQTQAKKILGYIWTFEGAALPMWAIIKRLKTILSGYSGPVFITDCANCKGYFEGCVVSSEEVTEEEALAYFNENVQKDKDHYSDFPDEDETD